MLAAIAFASSAAYAHASPGPKKVWESTKASTPECVFFDKKGGALYVTNGNSDPMAKDGDGYISKFSLAGELIAEKWATGLDSPKGMDIANGHLFVGDVDSIVEIDLKDGSVVAKHAAEGAKLLNDVAADSNGAVYVSDTAGNQIFRLADGKVESWLKTDTIAGPNGLIVDGLNLIVNSWGVLTGDGWKTSELGQLYSVSLADKSFSALGQGKPVGNLDGLQPLGGGEYLLGDFMAGKVFKFSADGTVKDVLTLETGSADFDYDPETKTVFTPNMMKNTVGAYTIKP